MYRGKLCDFSCRVSRERHAVSSCDRRRSFFPSFGRMEQRNSGSSNLSLDGFPDSRRLPRAADATALSKETRARHTDRVSIVPRDRDSFSSRASYDMLRKQYTAEASRSNGEKRPDYYALSTRENPGALFHLARIPRRAILLRATKAYLFCRYENLAKIKNRRLARPPPDSLFIFPPSSRFYPSSRFTYLRRCGVAEAMERVEKRRQMCVCV